MVQKVFLFGIVLAKSKNMISFVTSKKIVQFLQDRDARFLDG
jgi:hypothetical protein